MTDLDLFLYEAEVNEIRGLATSGPVLVWAGRGIGKSALADRIAGKTRVIRGREANAGPVLREVLKSGARPETDSAPIVVDDLDRAFDAELADVLQEVGQSALRRLRLVATSSTAPSDLLDRSRPADPVSIAWSIVLQSFQAERLNPWRLGWDRRLEDVLRRRLKELEEPVATAWAQAVVSASGGHPALVGAAMASLREELGAAPASAELAQVPVEAIELILESDLVERGFPWISAAISAARSVPELEAALIDLADDIEPPREAVLLQNDLLNTGLVYMDRKAGRLTLAGTVIRRWIRSLRTAAAKNPPRVRLEPFGEGADAGRLVLASGGTEAHVDLRGVQWRVLKSLVAAAGNVVPLERLGKETDLERAGVKSALQRLRAQLQAAGLGEVIENVFGEGYRVRPGAL